VRSGTSIKYYHIKAADGPLAKGTLLYTSKKTSNVNTQLFLDSAFLSVGAKLSAMQIFSNNHLPFSVDVYAPKPISTNAWQIDTTTADNNGVFTLGDKIKLTLTIDEAVTLAKVGSNKIMIAGKAFLLTGENGTVTNTLVFTYTVQINDKIDAQYFNISNKNDIILNNVTDSDGNNINFDSITYTTPVKLSNTSLDNNLTISSDKRITLTNGVYEKTTNAGWNSDVTSTKGFVNDGYVIAKIGALGKSMMLGLSSDDTDNSYGSIDYALYADGGIGSKFVIYENGDRKKDTGVAYAIGDYMKV
ncbi:hypothetical protein, partial [Bathymodiolus thermophilus thioautotrophic gill symbiont]